MSTKLDRTQVAVLFSRIASLDSRKPSLDAVEAFTAALIPMTPEDAMAAIDYHRETTDAWLMPVHINRIVKAWRNERIQKAGDPQPPHELADKPLLEIAWRRAWLDRVGDGRNPHLAAQELTAQALKELTQ